MSATTHQTAPEDRISLQQKSAYAVGMLVNNLQAAALPAMAVILNLGLGMDVLWVGLIGAIPRVFDAISDPLLGYISDNTNSRWGRRRPFIFVGAIVAGLVFALMWQLPSGYVDLVAEKPISEHQTLYPVAAPAEFNDGGGIILDCEPAIQADVGFVIHGPELMALVDGPAGATNLDGFPQVEVNMDIPPASSMRIVFDEAGAEGESFSYALTRDQADDERGNLFKFKLSDLELDPTGGNQTGNSKLDVQSLGSITLLISGLQQSGTATIHSVKLRKSESFFIKYFWYFLFMSILFFLAYTVYATPFVAFGYEMTPDYHERTRLHAFANTVGQLAWLGVPWFYAIMASDLFQNKVHGARTLAIVVGLIVALFGIVPAVFCRERIKPIPEPVKEAKKSLLQNMTEFWKGILITFKCKPFVKICGATFLVFNGFQLGVSFSIYVMIYYLFNGSDASAGKLMGWFGMLTSVATLLVIPLTAWIATHVGKRKTFLITISLSLLGYCVKWVGYNPDHPYWLLAAAPLVAFGTGSLFTLMGSMISDVCDYDELQTNQRREGVFGAIYWWMVKVGMALAGLLTGVLLKFSGFDQALGAGQADQTLFLLRIFDVGIPLITSAIALTIIARYSITEEKAHEIRAELENRRGKISA